jgi:hypothetical protein
VNNNVGSGFVRDNIAAGTDGNPVISVPGFVNLINNRVGTVSGLGFVDSARRNFRLSLNSPARNKGGNIFPNTDFDDKARPKDALPIKERSRCSGN